MEDTVPGRNLSRTCCNPDCRFMMTENKWMAYCCDIFSQDNVCTGCTAMDSFVFYFIFSNYRWGRCSFSATAQLVFLRATHSSHTPSLSLPWITFSVIKGGGKYYVHLDCDCTHVYCCATFSFHVITIEFCSRYIRSATDSTSCFTELFVFTVVSLGKCVSSV